MIRYIPLDQLDGVLARLNRVLQDHWLPWTRRRDAAGVLLGLHGLRVLEICQLTKADLLPTLHLDVRTIKKGNHRAVPIQLHTHDILQKISRQIPKSQWLLPTKTGGQLATRHLRRSWEK